MGDNKKFAIAGLASILLVAAVVGVVVSTKKSGGSGGADTTSGSTKAVQAICSPTNYKETCEKSLANANTNDPKELLKAAFDATVKDISNVLKDSSLLKDAEASPNSKDSYKVCKEVLDRAVEDLKRSIEKVGAFDASKMNEYVEDLKTWLSAVVTYQETCIDAFNETSSEAGEKMKTLLTTAKQLSSNGLAMVNANSFVGALNLGGSRRLLSEEPAYVTRRLQEASRLSSEPTIVVAQDGSGNFTNISDAIATLKPDKSNNTIVIYVKAGTYNETVDFPKNVNNVMLIGDGPLKTIITGDKCFAKGIKTWFTATVSVNADDFFAKDIAFENTAGYIGEQAVALRVSGDKAVFYNVHLNGYQDTLYSHNYRQYYRDCSISGTIDFIFGDSLSIYQNCNFVVRKPGPRQGCMITAQGRIDPNSVGAFVIQNGNITAEDAFLAAQPQHKAYLGRPWKDLSRTIFMESEIGGFIDPSGWAPWNGDFALDTCYYAEFANRGDGSKTAERVQWKGIKSITKEDAEKWTGGVAYVGDEWITKTGVPYVPTMMNV